MLEYLKYHAECYSVCVVGTFLISEYVPFTMTKTENRKRLETRSLSKSVLFSISISTSESLAAQFLGGLSLNLIFT